MHVHPYLHTIYTHTHSHTHTHTRTHTHTHVLANIDYEPVTNLLVFGEPSNQNNQTYCFDITIRDDIILEDTETFQVVLETSDPGVHLVQDTTKIYVLDDDGVRMGLSEREYYTSESDRSVPICVELVGMIEQNIIVTLNTHSGSAQGKIEILETIMLYSLTTLL